MLQLFIIYWIPLLYLVIINLAAFVAMWWDKKRAREHNWRIAEAFLFLIAAIGGAIGLFAGMFRFRHKTRKRSFQAVAILALLVSLIIYWIVLNFYL